MLLLYESRRRSLLQIAEIHGVIDSHQPLGDLGKSAALISEEIRGYVTGLKNDANSLREDATSGYRAEVTRIENARRRLESFTDGILEFSKSGTLGRVEAIDVAALVDACLEREFRDCRDRIQFRERGRARILGDGEKLARALAELLRNALQAGAAAVSIRLRAGGSAVCLAIDDDGVGVDPAEAEKIARPFFTTRKAKGANGLGASIADGLIKAHGGCLKFYPKSGAGTGLLVNVILPKADSGERPLGIAPGLVPNGSSAGGNAIGEPCLLVSSDGARIGAFLDLCGNIGMRPLVLGAGDTLQGKDLSAVRIAILDAEPDATLARKRGLLKDMPCRLFLWNGNRLESGEAGMGREGRIFCEETFLAMLSG
jgi:hypothetical protein